MSKRIFDSHKRIGLSLLVAALAVILFMPVQGRDFPDIELPAPLDLADRERLGVPIGAETFRLSDLDADAVIIDAVNTRCVHCADSAPAVDELFRGLQAKSGGRLKTATVFVFDSPESMKAAASRFPGEHPKIADPDGKLMQVGEVVMPTLYLVHIGRNGKGHRLVYQRRGLLESPGDVQWAVLSRARGSYFKSLLALAGVWLR